MYRSFYIRCLSKGFGLDPLGLIPHHPPVLRLCPSLCSGALLDQFLFSLPAEPPARRVVVVLKRDDVIPEEGDPDFLKKNEISRS